MSGKNRQKDRVPKRQGHPSRATARQRRHWNEPADERERAVRELNRLMREELHKLPTADGEVAGPLSVVARFAVPQLLRDFGLDETHTPAFEHWLMAKFGDVLRDPDAQGYLAWRESCLATAADQGTTRCTSG